MLDFVVSSWVLGLEPRALQMLLCHCIASTGPVVPKLVDSLHRKPCEDSQQKKHQSEASRAIAWVELVLPIMPGPPLRL